MRACLFRGGLVLVLGLLSTRLIPADDGFGAGRKMQGASRYSSTGSPLDAARPSSPTASPFSLSTPRIAPRQDSAAENSAPSGAIEFSEKTNKIQEIFPTAGTSPAAATDVRHRGANQTASGSRGGGGLKSLQQRFTTMRKFAGANPASTESTEAPIVEPPSTPPQSQVATPRPAGGPNAGSPVPPTMPDIRTAQRLSSGPATAIGRGDSSAVPQSAFIAGASNENTRSGAIVGGPVVSSRRMPTGQAAGLPREDQPTTVSPTVERQGLGSEPATGNTANSPSPAISTRTDSAAPVRATPASRNSNVLFTRQSPLLGVETSGPRSITIGKEATYSVTVANSGDAAAQDVKISIRIPPWTEVVGATATSGSAQAAADSASEPLTWHVPRLESHGKEQLSLRLVPRESRPFDLAVQWTFSPVTSQAMVEVKEPKLAMSVAGPDEILFGETKVYKLSLSNPGTGDTENVVLFLSPIDGGAGSPTRHEIGNIAAGETKLVEVELTARQAGTLAIKSAAVADGNLRAEAAQEILVRRAGLKVVAEGPELKFAGTEAAFQIVVTNPGNATAESVEVAALLPAGAKYVSSNGGQFIAEQNKVVWAVPSLPSGGEQDLEMRCMLNSPGSNRLQVVALAASDLSDSTAMDTNVEALADLKLDVSDPTGPVAVGDEVTYEVRIRNRGTKAAEEVAVAGFFSGGIEPQSAQGGGHEMAAGQVVFKPIPSIAPGAEVVLEIKARAEQAGNHLFRAEVNCAAVGMKLAAEETTLFYGETGGRSARVATKPSEPAASAEQQPSQPSDDSGTTLLR